MSLEGSSWCRGAAGALLLLASACQSRSPEACLAVNSAAVIPAAPLVTTDSVAVSGVSGNANGAFVVGRGAHGAVQRIAEANGSVIEVGSLESLTGDHGPRNLAAAFTVDRPMAVKVGEPWSPGAKQVPLHFGTPIVIPLQVWLVYKPPVGVKRTVLQLRALYSILNTAMIWYEERVGTRLTWDQIGFDDVSDRAAASDLVDFESATDSAADLKGLGHHSGAINIYVVHSVNGDVGRGLTLPLGGDCIVMPSQAHVTLLAHELGHTFALDEASPLVFDERNVMRKDSICRRYFSEGQIFYAYYMPASAIYDVAGTPPSEVSTLFGTLNEKSLPFIDMRIWPDGSAAPAGLGTSPP